MISNPASEYSIISLIQTKQEYTLFAYNMSTEEKGGGGRRGFIRAHPADCIVAVTVHQAV